MAPEVNAYKLLERKVFEGFDIIRGEVSEYHIIFFLLVLKKERVIQDLHSDKRFIDMDLEDDIVKYEGAYGLVLSNLLDLMGEVFISLSDKCFNELKEWFVSLDEASIDQYFPELVDALIYKIAKFEGHFGNGYLLPMEIARFISNLFDFNKGDIYNPFAGYASFGIHFDNEVTYIGQEINRKTHTVGSLRLLAHGRNPYFYKNADSIDRWWSVKDISFDLVVSSPPFGMRLQNVSASELKDIQTVEQFVIHKGLASLNSKGKLIVVIPQGFLFRGGSEQRTRKYLVEQDLLEIVVSFPGGLLSNTSIPISVIVINKDKKQKGYVRFVNAEKYVESLSPREKKLNDQALNSIIWSEVDNEALSIVSNKEIAESDFNLEVKRYFLHAKQGLGQEGDESVLMGDLVTSIRGSKPSGQTKGKFIRIRDLRDDRFDFQLNADQVEEQDIPKHALKIEESVLLIAARWNSLKPTYFHYQSEPIFVSPDLLAFRVNEDIVKVDYLIGELYSDYLTQQIAAIRVGSLVPTLRKQDFLHLKVQLPSLEEQMAKSRGAREAIIEEKNREKKLRQQLNELENEIYDQNSFLRHSIAGPLKNIRGAVKGLKAILETRIVPMIPHVYSLKANESSHLDLRKYLEMLERDLIKVSENTRRNTKDTDAIINARLDHIEIFSFLEKYVQEVKLRERLSFELNLNLDEEAFRDEKGNRIEPTILGNIDLLFDLFNNLIENAEVHAFDKSASVKNKIEFHLTIDTTAKDELKLLVSNTGHPFPLNFSQEMYIRKGSKSGKHAGDGYGGWYINEIVKKHKGHFAIIKESELGEQNGFATTFSFSFPIATN